MSCRGRSRSGPHQILIGFAVLLLVAIVPNRGAAQVLIDVIADSEILPPSAFGDAMINDLGEIVFGGLGSYWVYTDGRGLRQIIERDFQVPGGATLRALSVAGALFTLGELTELRLFDLSSGSSVRLIGAGDLVPIGNEQEPLNPGIVPCPRCLNSRGEALFHTIQGDRSRLFVVDVSRNVTEVPTSDADPSLSITPLDLNDSGDSLYLGFTQEPAQFSGAHFVARAGSSTAEIVARERDGLFGKEDAFLTAAGRVVLRSDVLVGETGIFWADADAGVRRVVGPGDPAPATDGVFGDAGVPDFVFAVNDLGALVLSAFATTETSGLRIFPGIWKVDPEGTVENVPLFGDAISEMSSIPSRPLAINDRGQMLLIGRQANVGDALVLVSPDPEGEGPDEEIVLLREGDSITSQTGVRRTVSSFRLFQENAELPDQVRGRNFLNNRGEVLVIASFTDFTSALLRVRLPECLASGALSVGFEQAGNGSVVIDVDVSNASVSADGESIPGVLNGQVAVTLSCEDSSCEIPLPQASEFAGQCSVVPGVDSCVLDTTDSTGNTILIAIGESGLSIPPDGQRDLAEVVIEITDPVPFVSRAAGGLLTVSDTECPEVPPQSGFALFGAEAFCAAAATLDVSVQETPVVGEEAISRVLIDVAISNGSMILPSAGSVSGAVQGELSLTFACADQECTSPLEGVVAFEDCFAIDESVESCLFDGGNELAISLVPEGLVLAPEERRLLVSMAARRLSGEAFFSRAEGGSVQVDPLSCDSGQAVADVRAGTSCTGSDALIVFGNGVFNTQEDAFVSAVRLQQALADELPRPVTPFAVTTAYAQCGGLVGGVDECWGDLVEALIQRTGLSVRRVLRILSGLEPLTDPVREAFEDLVADVDLIAIALNTDFEGHLNRYGSEIQSGRSVIVVAHSQGNLFANQAFSQLETTISGDALDRLRIVPVASPDSQAPTGGLEHITLFEDRVIDSLRRVGLPTLPPNTTNNMSEAEIDASSGGHSFVSAYLDGGEQASRARIVEQVLTALDATSEACP